MQGPSFRKDRLVHRQHHTRLAVVSQARLLVVRRAVQVGEHVLREARVRHKVEQDGDKLEQEGPAVLVDNPPQLQFLEVELDGLVVLPVLAVLVLPRGKVHVLNEWLCDHQGMSLKHGEAFLQEAFTE